jgi:hypothetical protein
MAFDEYQFLRYFIPGSLFVSYLFLLIVPCLNNEAINYFVKHTEFTIGIAGGAFAASPAIGYAIYSLYTATDYDKDSVLHKDKGINQYLKKKLEFWNDDFPICQKKEFLDFLYYWKDENNQSENFYSKIHGIWSHFVARKVAAWYVSITAIAVFFICYLFALVTNTGSVFIYPPTIWLALSIIAITLISLSLWTHASQTRQEAWQLELYYLSNKIENSKDDKGDAFEKLVYSFFNKNPADSKSIHITPENLSKFEQLIERMENAAGVSEKNRLLTKLDGLYTFLISLSTFLIGIAVSQRVSLGLNTILWFPLIGIVVTMVISFILGVRGMIIAREAIINRMLAYCLLLSLPIWLVTVPLLMLISTNLNSLELVGAVFLTGFLLSLVTFFLSKRLITWFTREFPYLFVGEKDLYKKIRTKIIPYVTIILAISTIITTVIILVSFQSAVQEIINASPSLSPTPTS